MISKVRPMHVALFIASLLYLIAGTAKGAAPLGIEVPTPEVVGGEQVPQSPGNAGAGVPFGLAPTLVG
jgi:hypothetical protein